MISRAKILDLEELLQNVYEKDLPDMRSAGVESTYWAGKKSCLTMMN